MSDADPAPPSCPQLDVHQASTQAGDGAVTLVDVREPDEFAAGHPSGACNIPLGRVEEAVGELPAGPIAFSCKSGRRSQKAADAAVAAGRTDITNVSGGFEAWQEAGLPIQTIPEGQAPA
jgi:rhodanese-related sulfurtransferase